MCWGNTFRASHNRTLASLCNKSLFITHCWVLLWLCVSPLSLPPPRVRWCHPILWENATHWPRCITRRPLLLRYLSSTLALLPRRFSSLMRLNRAFVSASLLDSPDSASIALLNHSICLDTGRRPNSVQRSRHPTEAFAVPIRMLSQHLPACN